MKRYILLFLSIMLIPLAAYGEESRVIYQSDSFSNFSLGMSIEECKKLIEDLYDIQPIEKTGINNSEVLSSLTLSDPFIISVFDYESEYVEFLFESNSLKTMILSISNIPPFIDKQNPDIHDIQQYIHSSADIYFSICELFEQELVLPTDGEFYIIDNFDNILKYNYPIKNNSRDKSIILQILDQEQEVVFSECFYNVRCVITKSSSVLPEYPISLCNISVIIGNKEIKRENPFCGENGLYSLN